MACNNCGKSKCSCSSSSNKEVASLKNEVQELTDLVSALVEQTAFLKGGHPILIIEHADDVALFNLSTGLGSAKWEGWAICDGQTQWSELNNKNVDTPNFLDKFVMCAGSTYSVDDTGGAATVVLTVPNLPAHAHTLTDPGHTHDVTDPGHSHGGSSGSHTHTVTSPPHTHTMEAGGAHTHTLQTTDSHTGYAGAAAEFSLNDAGAGTSSQQNTNSDPSSHTHTLSNTTTTHTASSESVSVTVASAFIGITETESHEAGITMAETGEGEAHDNIPPFYAAIYVMKL